MNNLRQDVGDTGADTIRQPPARVGVVVGSTRPTRICAEIATLVAEYLATESPLKYVLVDLAEINLPFLDEPRKPALGRYEHDHTRAWSNRILSFDGFVFVFPQYNWGYPAVLKNALDFLYEEWKGKPAALVSYGTRGGARAAEQLRTVLTGLHMDVIADNVQIKIPANDVDAAGQLVNARQTLADYLVEFKAMDSQLSACFRLCIGRLLIVDFGIAGRKAIVCASSQGIGLACATALAGEGVEVWLNGRHAESLMRAVSEVSNHGPLAAHGVVGDLVTEEGRKALLEACPEPDILVTNNRGPRPGRLDEISVADLSEAIDLHFSAPIYLLRAVIDGMVSRRFGRIVNITSAVVTRPSATMVASSGARAGLTSVMKAVSKDVARHNVTINNILPERIDSGRQLELARRASERANISFEEARRRQAESVAAQRLGTPAEIAAACAFFCAAQAGYISGNNLHVDGGSYLGLI